MRTNVRLSFLDLLFILVMGFTTLFFLALIEEKAKSANIHTKAEFVIKMTWPSKDPNDVDMWLQDPLGNICFFPEKDQNVGLLHLDRDDKGHDDIITMPDGTKIIYPFNQEIMSIRGIIPGEYTLNIHLYRINPNVDMGNPASVVTIVMDKLNPKVERKLFRVITFKKHWEEITVAKFTLNNKGNVININNMFESLLQKRSDIYDRRESVATSHRVGGIHE